MEMGDITQCNGRGGFSVYGKSFAEENHKLKHTKAGKNMITGYVTQYTLYLILPNIFNTKIKNIILFLSGYIINSIC